MPSRKRTNLKLLPVAASVVTAFIIYALLAHTHPNAGYGILAIELGVALISSIMVQLYISKPRKFVLMLLLLLSGLIVYGYSHAGGFVPIGIFGISTIYGLSYRNMGRKRASPSGNSSRPKETSRDVVQIALGAVLVAVFILLKFGAAVPVAFALIISGYVFNNFAGEHTLNGIHKPIKLKLERTGVVYGSGALYLAAGTALVIGFANTSAFAVFGIIVLSFSDSAATIMGVNLGGLKLPYNRNKSVIGAFAFFLVTVLLGYLAIGTAAITLGVLLAFVESADTRIDDNITLSVALVIVSALTHL